MDKRQSNSLSLTTCVAYSAPSFIVAWLMTPVAIIQGIYAKHYGLSLNAIATILLIVRLVDAISDPLIGYYSDRYYRKSGTRKPFVLIGGVLFVLCAYFLYVPPKEVGAVYFTLWFIALYVAWTLYEVPHITWAGELADNAKDKTKIYSIRIMVSYTGLLCFYAIPLLPFFTSKAITPVTLQVSVSVAGLFMIPLLLYCLKNTPNCHDFPCDKLRLNTRKMEKKCPHTVTNHDALSVWYILTKNRPFLLLIIAYSLISIGAGMWYGLIFIFVDIYLDMGEQFAQMFMLAFVVGILVTPIWYQVAIRISKKNTWLISTFLFVICFIHTGTLTPHDTLFDELLLLKITQTIGFVCMGVMSQAMLSEVCDYGTWKFNKEQSATYFSIYTFSTKAASAIAMAVGLAIAGWYGFDATATAQSIDGVRGITIAMTWVPLLFTCLSMIAIFFCPINAYRHSIIQRRLNIRSARNNQQQILTSTRSPTPISVTTFGGEKKWQRNHYDCDS